MAHNYVTPDTITLAQLGGIKKDATTVPDSEEYVASNSWNELVANVAGMTRTIPKAVAKVNIQTTAITMVDFNTVWGDGYEPTLAYADSTGQFTITFEASVSDSLIDSGETDYVGLSKHNLSLWAVTASSDDTGAANLVRASATANVVSIFIYDVDGVADNPGNMNVTIVAY